MPRRAAGRERCSGRSTFRWGSAAGVVALAAVILVAGVARVAAQTNASGQIEDRALINPKPIDTLVGTAPKLTLMGLPPQTPRTAGEKQIELNVVYSDSAIYNPGTGRKDRVRLRSYVGADADPRRPYVAPTIDVAPGDTVRITLNNKLPADLACIDPSENVNAPHCFNGTNLHTHGLWVSPAGNSDNVLLSINPGVSFQYEYNIPPDHPAGTFWYHSHRHGSTALQVSSGMAGALIVRGSRLPTIEGNGDIDTLLVGRDSKPMPERILVLQQIQYACLDAQGAIKVQRDDAGAVIAWPCDPGEVGGIEFYDDPGGNGLFGPGTWNQSGRFTSINGLVLPTFTAKAGRIERWRLIHAGVRDTISLELRALKKDAPTMDRLKAAEADRFIADFCTGDPLPYHLVAADGLTLAAARRVTQTTMQPGYRVDALVVFPAAGKYCVINGAVPASASVSRAAVDRRLLGVVAVKGGPAVLPVAEHVRDELISAARRTMPKAVRERVVADLREGLRLDKFTPLPDISDRELTGTQELTFRIDTSTEPPTFGIGAAGYPPRPYDPNRVDRVLKLGGADEWTLRSEFVGHPFHIHINPFQVVRINDPQGRDVSALDAIDDAGGGTPDPQYPGLKGVWKDTLWVKSLIPPATPPGGIYTAVVRTRYQRYIGEYVLHCHILDHEDRGMMQNVRIDVPDGGGGTVFAIID
ncbi:MAG: multicopper oxidase domain-containing protein [Rhodospirillales bacterium]|nr:multicopper oxidase domain-containing protein [Rhodospirillales bacterium]